MQEGEASPAPAPKIAAPLAITERAIDDTDRRATVLPRTAGEVRSILAAIFYPPGTAKFTLKPRLVTKAKYSLAELDEFAGQILRLHLYLEVIHMDLVTLWRPSPELKSCNDFR